MASKDWAVRSGGGGEVGGILPKIRSELAVSTQRPACRHLSYPRDFAWKNPHNGGLDYALLSSFSCPLKFFIFYLSGRGITTRDYGEMAHRMIMV